MNYSNLDDFYNKNKIKITEGYIGQNKEQISDIVKICKSNNFKYIMEIGFNAGHSSEIFLSNTNAYVYSFDLGEHFHEYLKYGKTYINNKYSNRHTLIFGNSTVTIPNFKNNNIIKFDLIFIDGGHDYDIAYSDLKNCRNLATDKTIVIMDDIVSDDKNDVSYTIGPKLAWNKLINDKLLIETSSYDYGYGRGQKVGHYLF